MKFIDFDTFSGNKHGNKHENLVSNQDARQSEMKVQQILTLFHEIHQFFHEILILFHEIHQFFMKY